MSRDVVTPAARARARSFTVGGPINPDAHQYPARWRCRVPAIHEPGTSESFRSAFAPGAVIRWRVPSENVTAIVVPVPRALRAWRRASTRPALYAFRRTSPAQSLPMAPTNPVRPPSAADARAEFVAFPPGRYVNRSTRD